MKGKRLLIFIINSLSTIGFVSKCTSVFNNNFEKEAALQKGTSNHPKLSVLLLRTPPHVSKSNSNLSLRRSQLILPLNLNGKHGV